MPQPSEVLARARHLLFAAAQRVRAFLFQAIRIMDEFRQAALDMVFADKMAVRRMFYIDPRSKKPTFTADGRRTIARWAKQAHVFNPSYAAEMNDEMKGMQKMFALIISDLLDDPIDFMQAMKEEEERRQEEFVPS